MSAKPPTDLSGKTALVTGGARGIGRAVALHLAARGAAIAVNYRARADAANEVVESIRSSGGQAIAVRADVCDKQAVETMIATVAEQLASADILINNAGLFLTGALLGFEDDDFDRMWRTNVKGVVNCVSAAAPAMIDSGWGRIVNIASNAGIGTAHPGTTLYAATKGAVLTLTKRMAYELSPQGIAVNAVLPGFTKTDMVLADKSPEQISTLIQNISDKSMLGRVGEPEDIAEVVGFLCSPQNSFMTGQFLLADGGRQDYLAHV